MKIAYDPQIFCGQVYGGVSRYFCELASRLAGEPGVDVSIMAPLYVNAYLQHLPSGLVKGFRGPPTDRFKSVYARLFFRAAGMAIGDLMLRANAPDIVHETYFFAYGLGPRRARRVLTVYDMIHERFPDDYPLGDKTAKHKAAAAKRADHVICISESTRRDLIEIVGLAPEKTSIIYLGFDLMKGRPSGAAGEGRLVSEPYLLYVGNRRGYKNFLGLLKAYASSRPLRNGFKLVCFGGGPFTGEELGAIAAQGLAEGQVLQMGGGDDLLARLYEHAGAFVYPSLYEGFGIPPLEAMSHDCPVVCGNTSSIPEVVGSGGEYFDPADVDSMREAIERVVGSDEHRRALVEKGRERLGHFSWDRCAAETLDIYRKLA